MLKLLPTEDQYKFWMQYSWNCLLTPWETSLNLWKWELSTSFLWDNPLCREEGVHIETHWLWCSKCVSRWGKWSLACEFSPFLSSWQKLEDIYRALLSHSPSYWGSSFCALQWPLKPSGENKNLSHKSTGTRRMMQYSGSLALGSRSLVFYVYHDCLSAA